MSCVFKANGMIRFNPIQGRKEYLIGNVRVWKENKDWMFQKIYIENRTNIIVDTPQNLVQITANDIIEQNHRVEDRWDLSLVENLDAFIFLGSIQPTEIQKTYESLKNASRIRLKDFLVTYLKKQMHEPSRYKIFYKDEFFPH